MSTCSNRLQPALQNLLRVVRFFHPRSSCLTYISADICGGRKSLVKLVTWQNISSCLVLSHKIITQDKFKVILWTSSDICVVHDDLGWKNRTTRYNCRFSAASLALRVIFSSGTTEQHVIIGFGELAAVD